MVHFSNIVFIKPASYECYKGDSHVYTSIKESEDALLFSLLSWQICNHVSNANLLNAANWSFTKINLCHVSFALIFNRLKIGKVFSSNT